LLLPCWWGVMLAAAADPDGLNLFDLWIVVGCAIGAFLMRGAGCTWNDMTDRDFDAAVARTKSRPIPSGQVTRETGLRLARDPVAAGLLHPADIQLARPSRSASCRSCRWRSIPSPSASPGGRRSSSGIAFNWGALLAWTAHTGSLGWPAVFLYLGGIAWTLFYDTIYAHQDTEDDALIGIKSTARLFGQNTGPWLRRFLVATITLIGLASSWRSCPAATSLRWSWRWRGSGRWAGTWRGNLGGSTSKTRALHDALSVQPRRGLHPCAVFCRCGGSLRGCKIEYARPTR
jgi:4-hydroxybenzoate polyprenyltransferase